MWVSPMLQLSPRLLMTCLLWTACASREVPSHLQKPSTTEAERAPLVDVDQALDRALQGDPLARALAPLHDAELLAIGADELAASLRSAASTSTLEQLNAVDVQEPPTLAVPFARGARLARVEQQTEGLLRGDEHARLQTQALLTLLPAAAPPATARPAWTWHTPEQSPHGAVLQYAETWVLRGWLAGPELPVTQLAPLLNHPTYDRLAETPEGQLLLARSQEVTGASDLTDLSRLVDLLLDHAASDRDGEQRAHRARALALAEERDLPPGDPLPAFAQLVFDDLLPMAADDQAGGGALLALAIRSWLEPGCEGCSLDRVQLMRRAGGWAPELGVPSQLAALAALKQAVDRFMVEQERDDLKEGAVLLADAMSGWGHPPDQAWLLRDGFQAGTWLTLTRATGAADGTSAEEGRRAINGLLSRLCEETLQLQLTRTQRQQVERIRGRSGQ